MLFKDLQSNLKCYFKGNTYTKVFTRKTVYFFRSNGHFHVVLAPLIQVGGYYGEGYVLEKNKDKSWMVYYTERGRSFSQRYFDSESEACSFFEKWCKGQIKYW